MHLTLDLLLKAIKDFGGHDMEEPVYIAPPVIAKDPELLNMFTRIAQAYHPMRKITVVTRSPNCMNFRLKIMQGREK